MKQYSSIAVNVKDSEGKWRALPALRGATAYEIAKRNGFTGTEEEWYNLSFDDGWVTKYQELEAEDTKIKENVSELEESVFNNDSSIKDVRKLILEQAPLWSVENPVVNLSDTPITATIGANRGNTDSYVQSFTLNNSGEVYAVLDPLYLDSDTNFTTHLNTAYIKMYKNDVEVISLVDEDLLASDTKGTLRYLLSVNRGDVIRFELYIDVRETASSTTSAKFYIGIDDFNLQANINTVHKYTSFIKDSTNVDATTILDVLLGEE